MKLPFGKALLLIAARFEIEDTKETAYGNNYIIKGTLKSPSGKIVFVKTVWFIEVGGTIPRFVTAIPDIISTRKKAHK